MTKLLHHFGWVSFTYQLTMMSWPHLKLQTHKRDTDDMFIWQVSWLATWHKTHKLLHHTVTGRFWLLLIVITIKAARLLTQRLFLALSLLFFFFVWPPAITDYECVRLRKTPLFLFEILFFLSHLLELDTSYVLFSKCCLSKLRSFKLFKCWAVKLVNHN